MTLTKRRFLCGAGAMALLTGCAATSNDLDQPPAPLGDFRLGHNIVVVQEPQQAPFSRQATDAELEAGLKEAIAARFGRYEGDKLYHLGLKIEAYGLAAPGVPILFKPKSVLVISANVWDDAAQKKLNEEPKSIIAFEEFSDKTFVGSGLTQTKEEQLANLTRVAAKKIEAWLLENGQWFGVEPVDSGIDDAADAQAALEAFTPPQ